MDDENGDNKTDNDMTRAKRDECEGEWLAWGSRNEYAKRRSSLNKII